MWASRTPNGLCDRIAVRTNPWGVSWTPLGFGDSRGPQGPQLMEFFSIRGILAECMPSMDFVVFLDETEGPHFRVPFFSSRFACLVLFFSLFLFLYLLHFLPLLPFCVLLSGLFFRRFRLYPAGPA